MHQQALIVSRELIRVAILWHELWHEGLEEASRFYYTEKNSEGMIAALEPLHEMLKQVRAVIFPLYLLTFSSIATGAHYRSRDLLRAGIWTGSI